MNDTTNKPKLNGYLKYWPILAFFVLQSFGIIWWSATTDAQITTLTADRFYAQDGLLLEASINENMRNIDRIDSSLLRIETKIDKLIEG